MAKYIAGSVVFHQIRPEQLDLQWMRNRAYRSGRGSAFLNIDNAVLLFGVPRYLLKKLMMDNLALIKAKLFANKKVLCLAMMEYAFTKGKVTQIKQSKMDETTH